jgi:hypothetical protein
MERIVRGGREDVKQFKYKKFQCFEERVLRKEEGKEGL